MTGPEHRPIDIARDRIVLLELHCLANYESETLWARNLSYEDYRSQWLATSQPDQFLTSLEGSLRDPRALAEVWEVEGKTAAFLWVRFTDVPDYNLVIAEIDEIAVLPEYQGQGVGKQLLEYAEIVAHQRGANVLRSETGIDNAASQRLHEKGGFSVYQVRFEKVLSQTVIYMSAEY
jgi:GNAT superfamily N-acetyltransferase